jgi:hypothetical protein
MTLILRKQKAQDSIEGRELSICSGKIEETIRGRVFAARARDERSTSRGGASWSQSDAKPPRHDLLVD